MCSECITGHDESPEAIRFLVFGGRCLDSLGGAIPQGVAMNRPLLLMVPIAYIHLLTLTAVHLQQWWRWTTFLIAADFACTFAQLPCGLRGHTMP